MQSFVGSGITNAAAQALATTNAQTVVTNGTATSQYLIIMVSIFLTKVLFVVLLKLLVRARHYV